MLSQSQSIFVAIPLHDGKIHGSCVAGLLQTQIAYSGRCQFETLTGSFLPKSRDILTSKFLDSQATHMLCVDSDIGFGPQHVNSLMDCDVDFVSGVYGQKTSTREVPARLNGEANGFLLGANHVPAGFILLSRQCVERMVGAYRKLEYSTPHGNCWALWSSIFQPGQEYCGEDVAFCNRWKAIGGDIWIDPEVQLKHFGDHCYLPGTYEDGILKFSK